MHIIERKTYRFVFELFKVGTENGMEMVPYRFEIGANSQEEAKEILQRDIAQILDQLKNYPWHQAALPTPEK